MAILISSEKNKSFYLAKWFLNNIKSPNLITFKLKWSYNYHKDKTNSENLAWNLCLTDIYKVLKFNTMLINPIVECLWSKIVTVNDFRTFNLIIHQIFTWQVQFNSEKTLMMLAIEIKSKILLKSNKTALLSLLEGKKNFSLDPEWWLLFSSFLSFQSQLNKSINHLWYGIKHIKKTKGLMAYFCSLAQRSLTSKQTHKLFQKLFCKEINTELVKKYIRWIIDNDKLKINSAIALISHDLTLNLSSCIFLLETFQINNLSDKLILNILQKMSTLHEDGYQVASFLIHFHEGRGEPEKVSDVHVRAFTKLKC